MARFDVYPNPGGSANSTPYLLDVQSNLLSGLDSRVVIPLRRLDRFPAVKLPQRFTPVVRVQDQDCLLETPKLAAVPVQILKTPVASLQAEQDRIVAALDFLFQGY